MSPDGSNGARGRPSPAGLTSAQLKCWDEDGYLVIENVLDKATVARLLEETHQMLADFPLAEHPMTKFSTGQGDSKHVGDEYFLDSGDKVRFFFEEDAFDTDGTLTKPKHRAINKIGHYLHELSPSFRAISLSHRNAGIARSLGFQDPRVLQSMIICKQPEIGGAVPPHQDSTFLYTNPPSAVGFWYALEDATVGNGCLSFAKGSHRRNPIQQRFVRSEDMNGTKFIDVEGSRFPGGFRMDDRQHDLQEEEYELRPVKAGSLVLIHGNVMHKSQKNLSQKSRFIYTFHMIEGSHQYDEKNWLQPPQAGFSRFEE